MNRRKKIFANTLQREILLLVFLAALLPTSIVTILLYHLIFGITAMQFGIPETIAYNIIPAARKVIFILLLAAPVYILIILIFAYKITHKIIGPFDRIVRELGDCVEGKREAPITLRKGDKFHPLVTKINKLLDKAKKGAT